MKKETYIKMTQPFRNNPGMAKGIHMINKICTIIMYVAYIFLLIYMIIVQDTHLLRIFIVPAISFVVLSVGRKLINRPRPYETFDTPPIIKKDTKGKSFPSRHIFCAAIIALTYYFMSPWAWLGIVFICITVVLAVVRVVSGVHYTSDVIAGFIVAFAAAVIGYVII